MITEIPCSLLDYTSTSGDDGINTGVSRSKTFELKIKDLMNETRLCHRAAQNLVRRGHNIITKITIMKILHWEQLEVIQDVIPLQNGLEKKLLNEYFCTPMSRNHVFWVMQSMLKTRIKEESWLIVDFDVGLLYQCWGK